MCADGVDKRIDGGQVFLLDIRSTCHIYALDGTGVITLTVQGLVNKSNNQIKFYDLGQDVLCEILPFDCQGECVNYRLKTKYIKLYKLGENCLFNFSGKKCVIEGEYNSFVFKRLEKCKKPYYILENRTSKWLTLLSEEEIIFNGKYIDYEELNQSVIKIYTHQPNVYNVGRVVEYNFSTDKLSSVAVKDNSTEIRLADKEFAEIYFMDAIMCGRIKLARGLLLSHELKSSIGEDILREYFGEIDDYIYLSVPCVYITLKNNNIVGVYHIVVNNGLVTSIY